VTQDCAEQMARGAVRLFDADVAVSATGVGGPGPSEGEPAGTVFLSVVTAQEVTSRELHLDGSPEEILEQTCEVAIALLADAVGADDTH
jgi:nicotinamide-nucleotide amidase